MSDEARQQRPAAQRDETAATTGRSKWFYIQRGETHGPVSSLDLRAAAHLGFLGPHDLVRRMDLERWVPACSIRGLFKESTWGTAPKGDPDVEEGP